MARQLQKHPRIAKSTPERAMLNCHGSLLMIVYIAQKDPLSFSLKDTFCAFDNFWILNLKDVVRRGILYSAYLCSCLYLPSPS